MSRDPSFQSFDCLQVFKFIYLLPLYQHPNKWLPCLSLPDETNVGQWPLSYGHPGTSLAQKSTRTFCTSSPTSSIPAWTCHSSEGKGSSTKSWQAYKRTRCDVPAGKITTADPGEFLLANFLLNMTNSWWAKACLSHKNE